jgi:hypothetical protein
MYFSIWYSPVQSILYLELKSPIWFLKVEWKGEKWIELNRVSVSPYVPALGSEVEKNPASIAASEKNRKRAQR